MRVLAILGLFIFPFTSLAVAQNNNLSAPSQQILSSQTAQTGTSRQTSGRQVSGYQQSTYRGSGGFQQSTYGGGFQQASYGGSTNMIEPPDVDSIPETMAEYAKQYKNLLPVEGERPDDPKLVQLCLLLDTSNSMDGLIDQAKSQLWIIVNEMAKAEKEDGDVRFEVALYEYGNDGLPVTEGYIRQVTPFTEDLDLLSEKLFSLTTNGGSEYCGHVIGAGLNQLKWNTSDEGLKMIYIAGNEPFSQGPVNFKATCGLAAERNVFINTIHCGDFQVGIDSHWQRGATIGKGNYFAIDSDKVTEGIPSPYDDELIKLNNKINQTYVPYGTSGQQNFMRQSAQDANAAGLSKSISASRTISKGGKFYKSSNWDLVEAYHDKEVTLDKVDRKYLSKDLQKKTDEELKVYIETKKEEREAVKKEIAELQKKRALFIEEKRKERAEEEGKTLGSAIIENIHKQANTQKFIFK